MAITRAQQAKQMLQNGGMLVQPGFGGARQGYKGGQDASSDDFGGGGNQDGNGGREDRIGNQYSSPEGKAVDRGSNRENVERVNKMLTGLRQTISPSTQPGNRALRTILNITTPGLGEVFARTIDKQQPDIFGTPKDDDNINRVEREEPSLFAPIVSQAPMTSAPVTSTPTVDTGANLNKIAYRLMADGGAVMDDEPRQAYGLGSIVKKATRAVKKVVKSDVGKAAIIGAGIYGLGGGFGSGFKFTNLPGAGFFTGASASAKAAAARDYMMGMGGKTRASSSLLGNIFKGKTGLAMAGIAGLSALPLLGVGVEEDEEKDQVLDPYLGEGLDIADIRSRPRFYQGQAYRLMSDGGSTDLLDDPNYKGWVKVYEKSPEAAEMNEKHSEYLNFYERNKTKQAEGSKEPVAKKVMPLLDMDGMEKDYREEGGFVPIGRMEKADDVPARLSKNEFVFTADAVRNAGDGSVDKGAEVMYNMMKNLEAGGEVSEESQGLEGARKMFQTSQRLEEVL
jgi:hypothetical protein